jgi:CDP-6-deoxy-D-xylo-4-hexulose-3-dehydrase
MTPIYPLACSSWDENEIISAIEVIKSGKCTMGAIVRQFEEKFAKQFGSKYAVMSNSGSSANLLAIAALKYTKINPFNDGDEVIVPAVSWSTTYYPLHQHNLKMKFVDIDLRTLNIDLNKIEAAIGPKTRAIFAVNLLGNPNNFDVLVDLCYKHDLILIEDNCESMGATFDNRECGTFGVMGTFSSFFSHHMCTIEGGITVTDDEELYQIMLSMRAHGWTRELPEHNWVHDKDGNPFNDLFRFVLPGYNLRPNEIYAAIGLHQLDKLPMIIENRRKNAKIFEQVKTELNNHFNGNLIFQSDYSKSNPSWFGFSMVLDGDLTGKRQRFVDQLVNHGVECRPIVAGNFAKNPVIKHMKCEISGNLDVADKIDKNGLFLGNSHLDLTTQLEHLTKILKRL